MALDTQIIDLRRSYVPIDPNAFPVTELDTTGEDHPEPRIPTIPYDGYNFMPTPQGYASFFGIGSYLNISTLVTSGGTGNVDDLFMIQSLTLDNILVALCDDGIWTKSASAIGDWTQIITLVPATDGTHPQWSKCVLENEVFVYRQGAAGHWKATPGNSYVFTEEVPTFLNMTGQLGIFKAGGRLGYWDSENSIGWSALGNTQDFTPSAETLAGNTIFQDIVGKIVICIQNGTGFIIYCTKSIVQVSRNTSSPMLWQGKSLFNNNGISYREEAVYAEPDITHFAFTTQGLVQITGTPTISGTVNVQAEFINSEIATYMKEKRQPIYLKILNGRYLFFTVLDPSYVTGQIAFNVETIPENTLTFEGAALAIDEVTVGGSACKAMLAAQAVFDQRYIHNEIGVDTYEEASATGSVPIWEDHLATTIVPAVLDAYKGTGLHGSPDYFDGAAFANGGIARIDAGYEYFLPATERNLQLAAGYTPIDTVVDNTYNFYNRQDWLWYYEWDFCKDWIEAVERKSHPRVFSPIIVTVGPQDVTGAESSLTQYEYTFGPFVHLHFFSESNKYYGVAVKSAWLQKSITRGVRLKVVETKKITVTLAPYTYVGMDGVWGGNANTYGGAIPTSYPNYAAIPDAGTLAALITAGVGPPHTYTATRFNWFSVNKVRFVILHYDTGVYVGTGNADYTSNLAGGDVVEDAETIKTEQYFDALFTGHSFSYVDFPTCVYKNLGYTKIKGHGHYNLDGSFTVDDSTPEAADYTDICDAAPDKTPQSFFQDTPIGNPWCGFGTSVTIEGSVYSFPSQEVTIPAGAILLQIGSIEPIYPTFLGAFIFDIQYKKWGKMKQNFKRLLDYYPINDVAGDGIVPYDTFLPKSAMLSEDGLIYIFDQFPLDSYITYGKIGLYRKGFTQCEEVRVLNRSAFSGYVQLQGSLEGKDLTPALTLTHAYTDAVAITAPFGSSARWFNIKISGNYDLIGLEFRGHKTAHR